jgi:hypothetical protein
MHLPALRRVAIAGAQATAKQNSAIAAIATERYRLKHGRLPESLTKIDDEFLGDSSGRSQQLTDPFSGAPLLYKIEDTRLVIYSVGENKKDDGADVDAEEKRPQDVGFSLKR